MTSWFFTLYIIASVPFVGVLEITSVTETGAEWIVSGNVGTYPPTGYTGLDLPTNSMLACEFSVLRIITAGIVSGDLGFVVMQMTAVLADFLGLLFQFRIMFENHGLDASQRCQCFAMFDPHLGNLAHPLLVLSIRRFVLFVHRAVFSIGL